jgi:polysaccharide biosynthesis transport protein
MNGTNDKPDTIDGLPVGTSLAARPVPQWSGRPHDYGYGYQEAASEEGASLGQYWQAIFYRKWVVAGVLILGLAAGYFYAQTRIPIYRSVATIEIERVFPASATVNELVGLFGQSELFYQTQIELLKSQNVAQKFLDLMTRMKPREESEKTKNGQTAQKAPQEDPQALNEEKKAQLISAAAGRVQATPIRGTQLIEIQLEAEEPFLARQMLGIYVQAFIEETQRKRTELAEKMRTWLRKELEETEKQLRQSQQDLHSFAAKHGVIFVGDNPNLTMTFLNKATENLVQSKDSRVNLEAAGQEKEPALAPQSGNEYLMTLKGQLAQLKSEYMSMKAVYGSEYFKMGILKTRIESLENAISEIEKSAVQTALETAKKKETIAEETYEKSKQDVMKLSPLAVQYEVLKRIVEANGQVYVALLQKYKQAAVENEVVGHNIIVSSAPSLPVAAVYPNKIKIMGVAAVLGLLGGLALAVCLQKLDRSVKTTGEVEKSLNVPILGMIPKIGRIKKTANDQAISRNAEFLPYRSPVSPFADAIRIVQHTASSFIGTDGSSAITVSSSLPLEGKTFIAVSMAVAIASENQKVIVIDADLRRPRVQFVFDRPEGGPGLADLLTGKLTDLKKAIKKSQVPGLFFMTAGTLPKNPVALLKTRAMQDVIDSCKKAFDFVIIDAPPLLGLADASILSRQSDGLILVAKQGHTSVEVLRRAYDTAVRAQARVLGVVLNQAEAKSAGYHYYNSRYYGRYYHKDNTGPNLG